MNNEQRNKVIREAIRRGWKEGYPFSFERMYSEEQFISAQKWVQNIDKEIKEAKRWWWKHVWHCWKAIGIQAKKWNSSRFYVLIIAVSDMLKVDYPN